MGKPWRPLTKIQVAGDEKFLGPGCRELLGWIQAEGSVRLACVKMGLSYSKAWQILNRLEAETGVEVLMRRQGGKMGGETTLTKEGESLLCRYAAYERECQAAVKAIFLKHFQKEAIGYEADRN